MSPLARRLLPYLAVMASFAGLASGMLLGQQERPSASAPAIVEAPASAPNSRVPERVHVTTVHGKVERAGNDGRWQPLSVGVEVAVDDSLRTDQGASAHLRVGSKSSIEIAERSELTVREITRSVQRFKLTRGRLSAEVGADGSRVLRIEGNEGAVVETREGQVGVVRNDTSIAVAAKSGEATLRSAGKAVPVPAGRQASATNHKPPRPARPIPVRVLLRVANHQRPLPGDSTAWVQGMTSPGARVTVNGVSAEVDADGGFQARIPVSVGRNRVVAVVEDPLGRKEKRTLRPIFIEPPGSIDDLTIQWGSRDGS